MLPRQSRKGEPRISQAEAARRLGVTKWHLNRVLRGHRESRSLLERYAELTGQNPTTQQLGPVKCAICGRTKTSDGRAG
jgi:transcriptional regulator with XRE-family HTH domain